MSVNVMSLRPLKLGVALLGLTVAVHAAPKRKFDERGNPITASDKAAESKTAVATPASGNPPAGAPAMSPATTTSPAAVVPPAATAPADGAAESAAADEAAEAQKQKKALTQVYLENAQMYLRSQRLDKAIEFLRKSQEAGEDTFSQEARLQSLFLRARRGDQGLEAETEAVDEKLRLAALLRVADGYYACAREQAKRAECMNEAERLYAFTGELAPRSVEGRLARLRLGLLLIDTGRHEAALPHLTQTLLGELSSPLNAAGDIPYDRAYFQLGQLYERPWYHQDVHKARAAYRQVLKYKSSPYHAVARERIAFLERFGTGPR